MTNAQLDKYLDLIAKLIESKATTATEAAELVRQAKITENKKEKPVTTPSKTK